MNFIRIAATAILVLATAAAGAQQSPRKTYIVELADAPAATYRGTVPGYAATQPAPGSKLNVNATAVRAYLGYLDSKRAATVSTFGSTNVIHTYKVVFNGFSARLTDAEVLKLRSTAGVRAITLDQPRALDTNYTPSFLGLTGPNGLWSRNDAGGTPIKGENVIIAIIDSGVWPENPSFADRIDTSGKYLNYAQPGGTLVYSPLPAGRFLGTCQAGEGFSSAMCNNKLIGAQYFKAGFNASGSPLYALEYVSARDEDGHGSHTMSTAGGNSGADATVAGNAAGPISGIAPRARLAAYKVCWTDTLPGGVRDQPACFPSDSVAAIDKAVADGADVLNFSISGSRTSFLDPVEVAFFNANAAGVFVAASAGNNGPGNTVSHISPWITTVAASTHDRFTVATVTLGNGAAFSGPSFQKTGVPSTPLILSENAGVLPFASLSAADQTALRRCYNADDRAALGGSANATLDPVKVAGKMVVCVRGGNVLVNKSDAVKTAGGAAMILQNTPATANTVFPLAHAVPTVHLVAADSAAVLAYAATAGATASFSVSVQQAGVVAPVVADFSSRGPNQADLNVLKPDITAPGVDIIAAYTNVDVGAAERAAIIAGSLVPGPGAEMLQGTSMSSPHVAGAAALLRQAHPTWSPSAIKSALMTTATEVKLASNLPDPDRWGYGAGHLNPNGAVDPGAVYDANVFDYLDYVFGAIAPYNLNLASLTIAELVGRGTLLRTIKNVTSANATYVVSPSTALPGYTVAVSPPSVTLAPGASATLAVSLTRTTAPVNTWAFGQLVLSDGIRQITSPLTVRGSMLASLATIEDTRAVGTKIFTIGTGYTGTMQVAATGLVPATRSDGTVAQNQLVCFAFAVPAGAQHARFRLYNSETQGGSASDLDLEVYRGQAFVAGSFGGASDELVDLASPASDTYNACVVGFAPVGGSATFTLSSWVVGPAVGPQTLKAAGPSKVYVGGTASVAMSWNVAAGKRYLGVLQYKDGASALGSTLVSVDNVPAAPAVALAPLLVNKNGENGSGVR